ncbi:MAG: phosphatase PAP2 family protein [bacterium]
MRIIIALLLLSYNSFGLNKEERIKIGAVLGITGGLYIYDQRIKDFSQEHRNLTSDKIASFAKPFGDGRYTLPPLALFYLYGHFYEDKRAEEVALLSMKSFVLSGAFTQIIKFTTGRHRPNTGDKYNTWDGPHIPFSNDSFPSGHSSSAFAIATVFASEYKGIIPSLAYSIATLCALSRINDNCHWASDVFFGSCLGYFTAKGIIGLKKANYAFKVDRVNGLLVSYNFW